MKRVPKSQLFAIIGMRVATLLIILSSYVGLVPSERQLDNLWFGLFTGIPFLIFYCFKAYRKAQKLEKSATSPENPKFSKHIMLPLSVLVVSAIWYFANLHREMISQSLWLLLAILGFVLIYYFEDRE